MKKVILSFALIITLNCFVNAQSENNWIPVVSVSELVGSWTGSQDIEMPQNETAGIPHSFLLFSIHMEYIHGNKDITFEMIVDLGQFLDDWIKVPEMRELMVSKDQLWNILQGLLQNMLGEEATFDNTYKMFYLLKADAGSFVPSDNFCINETKNMVKLVFDDPISFGLGDEGITEMILAKN